MNITKAKKIYEAMNGDWENHGDIKLEDIIDLQPADTFDDFLKLNYDNQVKS